MTTPVKPICFDCIHRHGPKVRTCNAYPDKIPFEILTSEIDHHFPYKGDHGIQFQENKNKPKVVPFPHTLIS